MISHSDVEPSAPLAEDNKGNPRVYSVLGAFFHLEAIEPDDEARLDRVNALVLDWLGPRLAWTEASFLRGTPPFRQADVDYISGYCRTLELPADPDERSVASDFHFGRIDYSVHCGGGAKNSQPSPYSYQFWASELGDQSGPRLNVCSVLSVMVPDTWPHEDFMARITEIAATLRLRWGAAGLTYSRWDYYTYGDWFEDKLIHAHARRFHGYDVPEYLLHTARLHNAIRSINWLTFVGPALAERLRAAGKVLESAGPLAVSQAGSAVLIRAGDRPERCDINRLQVPQAYVAADALVRPVRASGTAAKTLVSFGKPWTVPETSDWLQRFGKGGVLPSAPSPDKDVPP